ncbi:hypothetical protein [Streptomyces sp. cg35]|uniref:hypothetical protein n=1 Tax=Streptomyces sp. cg35 TaxID=3421650 RepID=UPI003D172B82
MSFMADLMWDEATRDQVAEQAELARTAALTDAEQMLGPLVFQAASSEDLGHRMALADGHLQAIAARRGYPADRLAADLTRRWSLLHEARTASAAKQQHAVREQRTVTAAQEAQMDAAVASLAARAARENPSAPMSECLRMASEAVTKLADAFPLAYESWGGTADGPFTDRAKHWQPPKLPGAKETPAPAAAAAPNADAPDHDAPFRAAADELKPKWDAVTASWDWSKPFREVGDALRRRWDRTTGDPTGHAAEEDWHADNKAWHENLDRAQDEMASKWDANAAAPGASADHTSHSAPGSAHDLLSGFDKARDEMDQKWDANAAAPGASEGYHRPVPGGFSHTDTHSTGQMPLPTDPADHGFSHAAPSESTGAPRDYVIPSHFQYGRP